MKPTVKPKPTPFKFSAFIEPPAGSTLAVVEKTFNLAAATVPRLSENTSQIRETVIESLRRDGAPDDASGVWWDRLIEAEMHHVRSSIVQLEDCAPPQRAVGKPKSLLLAYAFMALLRFRRAVPRCPLEEAIRAVAVLLGPGITTDETRAAIAHWLAIIEASEPKWREALWNILPVLQRLDLGSTPVNVSVTPRELQQLSRSLAASRQTTGLQ